MYKGIAKFLNLQKKSENKLTGTACGEPKTATGEKRFVSFLTLLLSFCHFEKFRILERNRDREAGKLPFEDRKSLPILQRTSPCFATDGTLPGNGWSVATQGDVRCRAKYGVFVTKIGHFRTQNKASEKHKTPIPLNSKQLTKLSILGVFSSERQVGPEKRKETLC